MSAASSSRSAASTLPLTSRRCLPVVVLLTSPPPPSLSRSYDYTKGKLNQLVDVVIESGAKVFVSAVGVPTREVVDKLHRAGIVYMNMVGHPKHVRRCLELGADAICARAARAAAHTGDVPTTVLIPEVVRLCRGYRSPLTGPPGAGHRRRRHPQRPAAGRRPDDGRLGRVGRHALRADRRGRRPRRPQGGRPHRRLRRHPAHRHLHRPAAPRAPELVHRELGARAPGRDPRPDLQGQAALRVRRRPRPERRDQVAAPAWTCRPCPAPRPARSTSTT